MSDEALAHEFGAPEGPSLADEQYAPNNAPVAYGMGSDGLATVKLPASIEDTMSRPLTPDRFVCMEDLSSFRYKYGDAFISAEDVTFYPSKGVWLHTKDGSEVLPVRPKCENYVRQLMPFQGNDIHHNKCNRYCLAVKDGEGELYSLNDTEMLACEMRSPRDFVSENRLREHDTKVMAASEARIREENEEEFDVRGSLGSLG